MFCDRRQIVKTKFSCLWRFLVEQSVTQWKEKTSVSGACTCHGRQSGTQLPALELRLSLTSLGQQVWCWELEWKQWKKWDQLSFCLPQTVFDKRSHGGQSGSFHWTSCSEGRAVECENCKLWKTKQLSGSSPWPWNKFFYFSCQYCPHNKAQDFIVDWTEIGRHGRDVKWHHRNHWNNSGILFKIK